MFAIPWRTPGSSGAAVHRSPRLPVFVKLTLFVATLVVCAASILSWTGYVFARRLLKEQIDERFQTLTSDRQSFFLDGIADEKELIRLVARQDRLAELAEEIASGRAEVALLQAEAQAILTIEKSVSTNFETLWITNLDGKVILAGDPSYLGRDFSAEQSYLAGRVATQVGHLNWPTPGRAYSSTPLQNEAGAVVGVLMAVWDTEPLARAISDPTGLGSSGEVIIGTIVDDKLYFLVPPRHGEAEVTTDPEEFPALQRAISGETGFGQVSDYRHVPVLAFHRPVGYRNWGLVAKIDVAEAYAPVVHLRNNLLALQGAILLVGAAGSYLLARNLIRPIRQLTTTATAIAWGDLEARADVSSNDEIGALAAAFNQMAERLVQSNLTLEDRVEERTAQLAASEAALRKQTGILRSILDSMADGVIVVDERGRFVVFNPAAERNIGLGSIDISPAEWTSRYGYYLPDGVTPYPPDQLPLARAMRGEDVNHAEVFLRNANRPEGVDLSISGRPLRDETGAARGGVIVFQDVTEQRKAREALDAQAKELARSNAELEQFAYIASHDLQEPLRIVASYVQLLARRYKGKLDENADEFIQFAVDGAKRMQSLISDLLVYSRVGAGTRPLAPVDSSNAFTTALGNLKVAVEESHAEVASDHLPTVMADETQLTQLFQNLVGNAIKFHSQDPPKIRVRAEPHDGEWEFSVRDNGVGFDPKHSDRIFLIFQRLYNRSEYPGTGIGLALCKKIVERHGGRIWAESQPGQGSVFHFTLQGEPGETA